MRMIMTMRMVVVMGMTMGVPMVMAVFVIVCHIITPFKYLFNVSGSGAC